MSGSSKKTFAFLKKKAQPLHSSIINPLTRNIMGRNSRLSILLEVESEVERLLSKINIAIDAERKAEKAGEKPSYTWAPIKRAALDVKKVLSKITLLSWPYHE